MPKHLAPQHMAWQQDRMMSQTYAATYATIALEPGNPTYRFTVGVTNAATGNFDVVTYERVSESVALAQERLSR